MVHKTDDGKICLLYCYNRIYEIGKLKINLVLKTETEDEVQG